MSRARIGVIPWFFRDGELRVVLVKSADGDRWVLPKGKPKRGMTRRDLAALEAWEEAGARGRFTPKAPIDVKLRRADGDLPLRLYPLAISKLADRWPERRHRRRRVVSAKGARRLLDDPGMIAAVRALEQRVR